MIKKLKIKNFKWINEVEYNLWQDTIITGKNGSGKSTIIEAIVRCLTWEVNWYKKKLDASVTIETETMTTSRVKWNLLWSPPPNNIKRLLVGLIPWYLNSLTTKDKLDVILSRYTSKEERCANDIIQTDEDVTRVKKLVKEQQKLADVYAEELVDINNKVIDLGDINIWSLPELKKRYDNITENKRLINESLIIQHKIENNSQMIEDLTKDLWDFNKDGSLYSIREDLKTKRNNVSKLETKQSELRIKYSKLQSWICYTCWNKTSNNDELNRIKIEWQKIWDELQSLDKDNIDIQIESIDKQIDSYQSKLRISDEIDRLKDTTFEQIVIPSIEDYTTEEYEDLKLKLSNFEELFSKQQQKKLLEERRLILKGKISSLDYNQLQRWLDYYKEEELSYYEAISEDINSSFDFDLVLFKHNSTNDWYQLLFDISKNWVDYFWLSTAEKWLIDIQLSKSVALTDFILIDNWERFSTVNIKKIFQIMWEEQVILTKVSQGKLNIETE